MVFGDIICKIRAERNLTQAQLSKIFDVSQQAVQKWESGQATPDLDKIILISTHDPNLVVRTHPYMCIFRDENNSIYKTYVGSAFEEKMVNVCDDTDTVLWVEKCIKKCEGGNDAIIERERTYGHY